jgi:hypothetical protein
LNTGSALPYALYLDTKIAGAAAQLATYFLSGVFDASRTAVYVKKYKKHHRAVERVLSSAGLDFRFMSPGDLDGLREQTVFYLFNAQSNCRLVANRRLKHIFITHGESNKISSIKPITRIYDHVVMSGRLSLSRYFRSGLFDAHDYATRRLVMMGDTFIGRTQLGSAGETPVLFYAPTWEGGLPAEDYSSLGSRHACSALLHFSDLCGVRDILVKPHPNLGHRLPVYLDHLVNLLSRLARSGLKVHLQGNNVRLSMLQRLRLHAAGISRTDRPGDFHAVHALIDVSAMETQCINEGIPYHVLLDETRHDLARYVAADHLELYEQIAIRLGRDKVRFPDRLETDALRAFRDLVICYSDPSWSGQGPADRLINLVKYTSS